jgi:hypothetical protein
MKISDKLYIGFQRDRYAQDDDPRILAFAVPYDDTKSSVARRETVDGWREKDIEPRTIENSPQKYFKIVDVVSRQRTSNKLFRVLDPRGFELEISSDNLLRLISDCTITNGTILEDCIWAQHNTSYLLPKNSDEYKLHTNTLKTGKIEPEKGKFYISNSNGISVFRYEGIYHHTYIEWKARSTKDTVDRTGTTNNSWNYRERPVTKIEACEVTVTIKMNSGKKPTYVYSEFMLDGHGNVSRVTTNIRKSHLVLASEYVGEEFEEMKPQFNPMKFINYTGYSHQYADRTRDENAVLELNTNLVGEFIGLFEDKKDAINFDYTAYANSIIPKADYIKTRDDNSSSSYGAYHKDATNAKVNIAIKDERK